MDRDSIDGPLATDSVMFTNAFPESVPTIPVRRAIHTGNRVFPFRNHQSPKGDSVRWYGWAPIDENQVTLSEILRHAGYHTGLITDAYRQFKPSMNFHRGFDQFIFVRGQESDRYASPARAKHMDLSRYLTPKLEGTPRALALPGYLANIMDRQSEEDHFAPRVFREAMKFVEHNYAEGDFFLTVDSFDPHEPWDPPRYYTELYDPGFDGREIIFPQYGPTDVMSEPELKHMRALYAGEVTMVDKWIGQLIEKLHEVGVLNNTLVMLVSDHGHSLREHDLIGKLGHAQYPELMDVPMMIRHPLGEGAGTSVDAWAYDSDILPTALHLLGIEEPVPVEGHDLWPLTGGAPGKREFVTSCFQEYFRYQDDEHIYIGKADGSDRQLYEIASDPDLANNIAGDATELAEEIIAKIVDDAGGPLPEFDKESLRLVEPWHEMV